MPPVKKKKKKKKSEVVLTPAEKFEQMKALKTATRCILKKQDEYDVYTLLADEFAALAKTPEADAFEGMEECENLSEECRQKALKLEAELPKEEKEIARTVTTTAKEQDAQSGGKSNKGRWVAIAVCVLIAAAIVSYKMTPTRYVIAGAESVVGLHKYALESYAKLGSYKNSEQLKSQERILYAKKLEKQGDLEGAWKEYNTLIKQQIPDAEEMKTQLEQSMIKNAKATDTVLYGKSHWLVLEKQDDQVLLMHKEPLKGESSTGWNREIYEKKSQPTTWESSSLRRFLNAEFIATEFTSSELSYLEEVELKNSDNPVYNTKGGEDTSDQIFLLSIQEAEEYLDEMKDRARNLRLRTPGVDQTSTAFVSNQKEVIAYGFPVEQKGVNIRPVMWISYE